MTICPKECVSFWKGIHFTPTFSLLTLRVKYIFSCICICNPFFKPNNPHPLLPIHYYYHFFLFTQSSSTILLSRSSIILCHSSPSSKNPSDNGIIQDIWVMQYLLLLPIMNIFTHAFTCSVSQQSSEMNGFFWADGRKLLHNRFGL